MVTMGYFLAGISLVYALVYGMLYLSFEQNFSGWGYRHSPEVLRLLEKKLRDKGKPVPQWMIDTQKMPSCSMKIKDLGLSQIRDEQAIANVLRKQGKSQ